MEPMDQVIDTLRQRQNELRTELQRVDAALKALVPSVETPFPAPVVPRRLLSVRQMVVALLDEAGRDWSTQEILDEYQRRGTPIHGASPEKALRAAFNDAKKAGQIESTSRGRYKSTKFTPLPDGWQLEDGPDEPMT